MDTGTLPPSAAKQDGVTMDEAIKFVWYEADLLDSATYPEWLALWTPTSRYVVPIDPAATDFEATLNYAYDDRTMREKRAERLTSGQSVSASPVARTIRLLSRFRMLESSGAECVLRSAQLLTEFRRGRERMYAADVTHRLVRTGKQTAMGTGIQIERKVIRLINSTEGIGGIGYIL